MSVDTFKLKTPCQNCPFRTDVTPYIRVQYLKQVLADRHVFVCHKTVDYSHFDKGRKTSDTQPCAGFLICMQHDNKKNDLMQLAERLGLYDPSKMNMDAPVYKGAAAAIKAHEDEQAY